MSQRERMKANRASVADLMLIPACQGEAAAPAPEERHLARRSLYRTWAPMRLWLVHQALADVVKVAMATLSIMADAARAVRVAKGNTKKRNNEKGKETIVAGWNSRKKKY